MYVQKSGLELGLAQDGGLLGNLGGQARSGELTGELAACLATGKALPQRGNLERKLRSCWGLGQRGILPTILALFYLNPNLNSIKRQFHKLYFSSIYSFKRSFIFTAFYLLIWSFNSIKS